MTRRGQRDERIPGPLFACLNKVGLPVRIHGAEAVPGDRVRGRELVSRAAVAYDRAQAGLPPLTW
jgi:hypothetical protein